MPELFLGLLLGLAAGALGLLGLLHVSGRNVLVRSRQEAEQQRAALLKEAENRAREIELNAKQEALKVREASEAQQKASEAELKAFRRELDEREAVLNRR